MFYNDGDVTMIANPDLDPEEISTYEFIWEEQLTPSMLMVINGFYYEVDQMISQTTIDGDLLQFNNIDRSRAYGFEFALEGTLFDKFTTNLSYTFAKTENRTTGKELSNAPRHLGKLSIGMPLWNDKFFLHLEELYTSSRLSANLSERIDAFWITNLTLSTQALVNNLRVSLSLYNLFDKTYSDPGSLEHEQSRLEQHGRQFFLKAVYSF
jgi:outer membrane receptor protein involved in Fe transport